MAPSWTRILLRLAVAAAAFAPGALLAQTVDPKLAASWAFMQQAMPGVPYSVLESACRESQVMIYHGTWVDAQNAQIAGFVKRFPCITVNKFGTVAGEMRERFLAEARAGHDVADIMQDTDTGSLDAEAREGLLMHYVISNDKYFPNSAKKSGIWYSLRIALVGIAWNTDLVSDADAAILKDWKGVTDPRWNNHGVVVDPRAGGVAFLPWYAWNSLYGEDFIKKIGALHPRVVAGINSAAASLASGDVAIIFNASETGLVPLYLKGAPIRWSLPSPGVGPLTGQAIPAQAPHPDAARLYQEYSFTTEGYGLWQKLGGAPTRIGFKDQRKVAQEPWYKMPAEFWSYDPLKATAVTPGVIDEFDRDVGSAKK
jgi:iron(III) transport system substrate-binding protein